VSSPRHRRRTPTRGPLSSELQTILAAAGLPRADSDDRYRAFGVVVTDHGESAGVEWFVSRSLRRAAADEQMRGLPMAAAVRTHESARRHLHAALSGILSEAGYLVEAERTESTGAVVVHAKRGTASATLAADIKRILAELRASADDEEGPTPSA
jgi:hypothetical protein